MKELQIASIVSNIDEVTDFINQELDEFDCPMKIKIQLDVAIDEIFSNISNYAYNGKEGNVLIQTEYEKDTNMISIRFIDSGIPFNPLKHKEPDVTMSASQRQIGGLGIFLVIRTMDKVNYEHQDGKNMFTIWKKLSV